MCKESGKQLLRHGSAWQHSSHLGWDSPDLDIWTMAARWHAGCQWRFKHQKWGSGMEKWLSNSKGKHKHSKAAKQWFLEVRAPCFTQTPSNNSNNCTDCWCLEIGNQELRHPFKPQLYPVALKHSFLQNLHRWFPFLNVYVSSVLCDFPTSHVRLPYYQMHQKASKGYIPNMNMILYSY